MPEKQVVEVVVSDIDYVGLEPGITGAVRILFDTEGPQHIALVLRPEAYSKLETRLEELRELMARGSARQ